MNRFIRHSAALMAAALVFGCGALFTNTGGITAQAADAAVQVSTQTSVSAKASSNAVVLSWAKQGGESVYSIYRKSDDGKLSFVCNTGDEAAALTGLEPQTQYTFAVNVKTQQGEASIGEVTVKTGDKSTDAELDKKVSQGKVTKLSAKATLDTAVLEWEKDKNALSYEVYSVDAKGGLKLVKSTYGSRAELKGLKADTQYTFAVKGKAVSGFTAEAKVSVKTLKPEIKAEKAAAIEDISIENITATSAADSVTLKWTKVSGVETYNVYIDGGKGEYVLAASSKTDSVTVSGLSADKEYTFLVKGQTGKRFTQYSYAAAKTLPLDKTVITGFTALTSETTAELSWKKVNGLEKYNIYLKGSDGKYKLVGSTAADKITFKDLKPQTTYSYAVCGVVKGKTTQLSYTSAKTLRTEVEIKFEKLNQLGGGGNSGKVVATYGCGGTSVTMLLNAKGKNLSKDTVLKKQYTSGWNALFIKISFPFGAYSCGSVMSNLVDLAKSYGFNPKVNTAPKAIDIKRVLSNNELVLVGLRTARGAHHYQIVYGYYYKNGATCFRVQDPYGNKCVEWTESYLMERIYAVDTKDPLNKQVRGIMWL